MNGVCDEDCESACGRVSALASLFESACSNTPSYVNLHPANNVIICNKSHQHQLTPISPTSRHYSPINELLHKLTNGITPPDSTNHEPTTLPRENGLAVDERLSRSPSYECEGEGEGHPANLPLDKDEDYGVQNLVHLSKASKATPKTTALSTHHFCTNPHSFLPNNSNPQFPKLRIDSQSDKGQHLSIKSKICNNHIPANATNNNNNKGNPLPSNGRFGDDEFSVYDMNTFGLAALRNKKFVFDDSQYCQSSRDEDASLSIPQSETKTTRISNPTFPTSHSSSTSMPTSTVFTTSKFNPHQFLCPTKSYEEIFCKSTASLPAKNKLQSNLSNQQSKTKAATSVPSIATHSPLRTLPSPSPDSSPIFLHSLNSTLINDIEADDVSCKGAKSSTPHSSYEQRNVAKSYHEFLSSPSSSSSSLLSVSTAENSQSQNLTASIFTDSTACDSSELSSLQSLNQEDPSLQAPISSSIGNGSSTTTFYSSTNSSILVDSNQSFGNLSSSIFASSRNFPRSDSRGSIASLNSVVSITSSTSYLSPQELQHLIDEANQSLDECGISDHEIHVIILFREHMGGGIGITLAGGIDQEQKDIKIYKIILGSIADRDGRAKKNDRILSINGKNMKNLTHRQSVEILRSPRPEVVLVLSRSKSSSAQSLTPSCHQEVVLNGGSNYHSTNNADSSKNPASHPFPYALQTNNTSLYEVSESTHSSSSQLHREYTRVVLDSKGLCGLGFSLEGGRNFLNGIDKPLCIKKIFKGGSAERCEKLNVGDEIIEINGTAMQGRSHFEAWKYLKSLSDGKVSLLVFSRLSPNDSVLDIDKE